LNCLIVGAGSWGTALGILLQEKGETVSFWEYDREQVQRLQSDKENKKFLPGIPIPDEIFVYDKLDEACKRQHVIIFAVPSHVMREVAKQVAVCDLAACETVVNVAKGLEEGCLKTMSAVLRAELPSSLKERIVSLVGPSHAEEVSRRVPTAVVSACPDVKVAEQIQDLFMLSYFRVYTNPDQLGVDLAVSLKNVIAVAAGICDGLGYGDNTKGALLTRGLAEIARLGVALDANPITFSGLAGLGDLVTTCVSRHSRNRYVGEEIGKGRKLGDILSEMVMVAEGVKTTKAAVELARQTSVEMPIASQVSAILFEDKDPRVALEELMTRTPKVEVN
jgi:glycerol-3-phosphate dehydrogenase (NAD(P)+)